MELVGSSNMKFGILFAFLFLYTFVPWVSSQEDETLKVLKSKKLSELQAILSKVLDTVNETEEVTTRDPRLTGDPRKDYIYDPNLPRELGDHDLSTYPFYNEVPKDITFKCDGKLDGYYASVPHHCQLFHLCVFGHRHDFLCANYTVFDQSQFICHFVNAVNCSNSVKFYERNSELYVTTTTTIEPPEEEYEDYEVRPKRRRRPKNGRRRGQRRRTTTTTLSPDEYYYDDEELVEEGAEQPEEKTPPPATPEKVRRPALRPPKPVLRTSTTKPPPATLPAAPLAVEPIPLKTIPFPVRRTPAKEDAEIPADEPEVVEPIPARPIPVRRSQSRVKTEPPPVEPLEFDPIPVKTIQGPARRPQARENAESSAVDAVAVQPIPAQRILARRPQVSAKPTPLAVEPADEEPLPVQRIPARRLQAKQNADPPAVSEPLEEENPIPAQRIPARRPQSSARADPVAVDEVVEEDPIPVQRTPARRLQSRVRTPVITEPEFAQESKISTTKVKMFHDPMSVINPDVVVGNILAGVGAVPSTTLPPTTLDPSLEYEEDSSDEPLSDSEEPNSGSKRKRKPKVTTTAAPVGPDFVVGSILSGLGAGPTTTVPSTTPKRKIIRGRTRTPPVTTASKIDTTAPLPIQSEPEAATRRVKTPSQAASLSELAEPTSVTAAPAQRTRLVKRIRKPGGRTTTTTTLSPEPAVEYEYSE